VCFPLSLICFRNLTCNKLTQTRTHAHSFIHINAHTRSHKNIHTHPYTSHTLSHIYACTLFPLCSPSCIHEQIWLCMYTYVYIYIYIYVYIYIYACLSLSVNTNTLCVCVCVRARSCMCVPVLERHCFHLSLISDRQCCLRVPFPCACACVCVREHVCAPVYARVCVLFACLLCNRYCQVSLDSAEGKPRASATRLVPKLLRVRFVEW